MKTRRIKEEYNRPVWDDLDKFTRPNGTLETGRDGQTVFIPQQLPPAITYDKELIALLVRAERKVGELKGRGSTVKNPHILTRAYLKREAVLSSKIEGTLASLGDLNKHEALGNILKEDADELRLREVVNYVEALEDALEKIRGKDKKISLKIMKDAHKKLMTGVRGGDKKPGQLRSQQNWIVKTRGTLQTIVYAPPPPEKITKLLENLEEFFQTDHENLSALIQCAVFHYQFEAIHPFLDGNGRIGRLMLPLILYKKGLMPEPLLYLSAFFDRHKEEYYNGLLQVSQKSMWREWIKFFLRAFAEQAEETINDIQKLADLEKKYREILRAKKTSNNTVLLMEHLFSNPYITIPKAQQYLNVTYPSAKNAVMNLADAGILRQLNAVHKSKIFVAKEIQENL